MVAALDSLRYGRLAQLVEHLVYTERVGGSSPSLPTTSKWRSSVERVSGYILRLIYASLVVPFLILQAGPAHAVEPMSFSITPVGAVNGICGRKCAEVISAEGEINNDTADTFLSFLSTHVQDQALRPVILLESPGGTVVGAMQLGMLFRKIGAAVIVAQAVGDAQSEQVRVAPGLCMSACVYAFIGGKKRVVPSVSKLGIHRMVINESVHSLFGGTTQTQTFGTEDIVSALADYTRMMGVDPSMIAYAEQVAPESIHIVTARQIARWRLGSPHL